MSKTTLFLTDASNVYKRDDSRYWQCSGPILTIRIFRHQQPKEESLGKAKDFAEDWYLELRRQAQTRRARLKKRPSTMRRPNF